MTHYIIRLDNHYKATIIAGPMELATLETWVKEVRNNEQHCYDKEHIILTSVVEEFDRTKP